MEEERFIEKLLILVAVMAVCAYVYLNFKTLSAERVIELGDKHGPGFIASGDLAEARVFFSDESGSTACVRSEKGSRWQCANNGWNYVGVTVKRMGNVITKCVWAHPFSNKTLTISYPGVELGGRLVGFFGLVDGSDELEGIRPVNFTVYVGGLEHFSGSATYPGKNSFSIQTTAGRQDVEFRVATDNDMARHFCFEASSQTT